jgi:serine/threonine protein kinase
VAIQCPYCQHALALKEVRPGRYTPKCPKCARRFGLHVRSDPAKPPVISAIEEPAPAPAAAPQAETTGIFAGASAAVSTATEKPTGTFAGDATGAFTPPPGAEEAVRPADVTGAFAPEPSGSSNDTTGAWSGDSTAAGGTGAWSPPAASAERTIDLGAGAATRAGGSQAETRAGAIGQDAAAAMPQALGGYRLVKELGRGGMGSVYLARQLSLDRNVALKVMQPQWARDAAFVARFTREAYAAAQLTHHNVVQIYDIGAEREAHYFSMEFVEGRSLSDLVKETGKLDPEVAVGYVLQAARGLKYAHDQGMIHRDVKPDNLLLNKHGIVKVADLGLVKVPGGEPPASATSSPGAAPSADPPPASGPQGISAPTKLEKSAAANVTLAGVAIGTPAYMSPEQATSAATVDHRADIYSLGCTLYVLVTGKPPFEGKTAWEVITKHKTEPMVRPDVVVRHVPKDLADIVMKMVAKRPEDRYTDLDETIRALEGFLGVTPSAGFSPREEHVQTLEQGVARFHAASAARVRMPLALGFALVVALTTLGCAMFGAWKYAGGCLGLGLLTVAAYFLIGGLRGRTHLFGKVRQWVFGARWKDWLVWGLAAVVFVLALWALGWFWIWLAIAVLAIALAAAYHALIDVRLAAQRQAAVGQLEGLLKSLRIKGTDEAALQGFVARYAGDRWEEPFETLFGYESKLAARQHGGERGQRRPRFRGWRDPLVRWIDSRQRLRREAKELKHLEEVETRGHQAAGMTLADARARATRTAESLVGQAAEIRETMASGQAAGGTQHDQAQKRARLKAMLESAASADPPPPGRKIARLAVSPVALLLGPELRFLAGAALVALCLLWVKQNDIFTGQRLSDLASTAQESVRAGGVDTATAAARRFGEGISTLPLKLPLLPESLAAKLFNSFAPGVAGLILVFSALFRGWKILLFALPGAALALLGHLALPHLGGWNTAVASLAGLAVAGLAVVFARGRES